MMAHPFYLQTEQLSVGYAGRAIIDGIELGVRRGEILTLIGPNGAGKTTILKSLARQLAPIRGTVYLEKQPMSRMNEQQLARKLALVTTERLRPEWMNCREVVATGRYPYTGRMGLLQKEDQSIIDDALRQVHAESLAAVPFTQISDGQRQRVMLARALCQQPEILILDEPTSFLDIRHKLEILDILKTLVRQNQLAVIVSLHELDLAQKISDTVACVRSGRVESCGSPEEIFTDERISALYGLTTGSYNALFGCVELNTVQQPPELFVIGGGGSGIPLYRKLQRRGIPFAAGILHQNDLDAPVARALAARLIEEKAYQPIQPETLQTALSVLSECRGAVCCLPEFGVYNVENVQLWQAAEQAGKQLDWKTL